MSETTKNADTQSPRPSQEFREAIFREWVRQFTLKANGTPRPSTFAAEGGAERATTNSLAENGPGCTGRKMALITMVIFCALLVEILVILVSRTGWVIGLLLSAVVYAGGFLLAVLAEMARGRASGGEGV